MTVSLRRTLCASLWIGSFLAVDGVPAAQPERVITVAEALQSARENNITWKSLAELLVQAEAAKGIAVGMFLPKLQAEGQWLHLGERHTMDMSGFTSMGEVLGSLLGAVLEEHPGQAARFAPYAGQLGPGSAGSGSLDDLMPKADTISGTFAILVPVLNPTAFPLYQGARAQHQAALQRVAHARAQLLYAVAAGYYGLLTLQSLMTVTERSIDAAREHHRSNEVRARLQAATRLEVKRAELEVTRAESQEVELLTNLEKTKVTFRYLTGLKGDFQLVRPELAQPSADQPLASFQALAERHRRDLLAARLEAEVSAREVRKVFMKYLPTLNLFGQLRADNAEAQRFDDDPFSWTAGATLSLNVWDGGLRERELDIARSRLRQAELTVLDLRRDIQGKIEAAFQALKNAATASQLAERGLDLARDTQKLAIASEASGAATNLEVIDANTMVFGSEASAVSAKLKEAMAALELLAACGEEVPF